MLIGRCLQQELNSIGTEAPRGAFNRLTPDPRPSLMERSRRAGRAYRYYVVGT